MSVTLLFFTFSLIINLSTEESISLFSIFPLFINWLAKNLKELEKITETSLYSRGNSILIKSNPEKNEIVKNAIKFLANQFINNGHIENKDILSSVDKLMLK